MDRTKVVIMGAAGRDFHDFNVVYRDDPTVEVVAFTATQIPGIADRRYPPELAGPLYPAGIPIVPEDDLDQIFATQKIDRVVFAYSDVPYNYVLDRASIVNAAGADFKLLGAAAGGYFEPGVYEVIKPVAYFLAKFIKPPNDYASVIAFDLRPTPITVVVGPSASPFNSIRMPPLIYVSGLSSMLVAMSGTWGR